MRDLHAPAPPGPHRDACTALMILALRLRLALRTAAPCTAQSRPSPRVTVCGRCALSVVCGPGAPAPAPGAAATDRPSQPYACYQSYENKDVPTHTVYRQDLTVTPFAQASSDKPERTTRTRIPRRASPHPTIEHTSVNHTPNRREWKATKAVLELTLRRVRYPGRCDHCLAREAPNRAKFGPRLLWG